MGWAAAAGIGDKDEGFARDNRVADRWGFSTIGPTCQWWLVVVKRVCKVYSRSHLERPVSLVSVPLRCRRLPAKNAAETSSRKIFYYNLFFIFTFRLNYETV